MSISKKKLTWNSALMGKGYLECWEDFNSGINAVITIESIHMDISKFPKIAKVSVPAKASNHKMFTIDVDMETIKTWKTMIAIGLPVTIEQRISFK